LVYEYHLEDGSGVELEMNQQLLLSQKILLLLVP
jgi:hypothetical protein